jgi:hypothetical protein
LRQQAQIRILERRATLWAAAAAASRQRAPLHSILNALLLIAIGESAVRLSLMASILMLPPLAAALRETPFYELAFDRQARRYDRAVSAVLSMGVFVLVLAAAMVYARFDSTTWRALSEKLPVEEAAFLQKHSLTGRLLNTAEAGGYLMRTLGVPVSIDTRYDLYGDHAVFELLFALRGNAGWQEYVRRVDPDIVLSNNHYPLRHLLAASGAYRPVFEGPAYTVLIRHGQRADLPDVTLRPTHQAILDHLQNGKGVT